VKKAFRIKDNAAAIRKALEWQPQDEPRGVSLTNVSNVALAYKELLGETRWSKHLKTDMYKNDSLSCSTVRLPSALCYDGYTHIEKRKQYAAGKVLRQLIKAGSSGDVPVQKRV